MRRLLALSSMLAAAALSVTGCGGGGGADSSAIAQAATATANAGTAKVSLTGKVSANGRQIALTGSGEIDLRHKAVHMTVASGPVSIEEVMRHFVMYMRFPKQADRIKKALHTDKSWLRVDLAKAGKSAGIDLSSLGAGQNPQDQIEYLRAASGGVKKLGEGTVRGVRTTHYHAVVDLRRYPDTLPAARRKTARTSVERLIAISGESKLPVDVWIDARHRVRRERWIQHMNGAVMDMTMDTYDFGSAVRIATPPASDAKDFTDQAAQALQNSG